MQGPIRWTNVPANLQLEYTLWGTIPVYDWYIEETENPQINWTVPYVADFIDRFTPTKIAKSEHGKEPYENASIWHTYAFNKYPVAGKRVAVIGSLTPWLEAIALNCGAATPITTVEYNVPVCADSRIRTISYDDFSKSTEKYDAIITYSSIEHSGLGRYGDPLNPAGDIETMRHISDRLETGGHLFIGFPVGRDAIVWNAHRLYGPRLYERLLSAGNFDELEWIGTEKNFIHTCPPANNGPNPLIVLRKRAQAPLIQYF
jgi:hypothetical protein